MNKKLLSGPYLMWMIGFILIPLALIVFYGLTDKSGAFTLSNVLSISTEEHAKALWLSLGLSLLSTVLCLVLAYPLAMILRTRGMGQGSFIVFIFILPMWMNFLLRTLAWQTLLEKNGVINGILSTLHLPNQGLINTPGAIILGMVYNFLPFMVLPIYNVLMKIDDNVVNAARDLGANSLQVLIRILLPLSIPGIVSGITMVFCSCTYHLCYLQYIRRKQNPFNWKCNRTGIYKREQLELRLRPFSGPYDIYFNQHGAYCQV